MAIAARVIAIRYAERTAEHELGPGTDGFVVLRELHGRRHVVIIFHNAVGTSMLDLIFRLPGEPVFAHELTVELLRHCGATVEALAFQHDESGPQRNGTVTLKNANGSWIRECSAFDVVGFSIATNVPIMIPDEEFAEMYDAAPNLDWLMREGDESDFGKDAERAALADDTKKQNMN